SIRTQVPGQVDELPGARDARLTSSVSSRWCTGGTRVAKLQLGGSMAKKAARKTIAKTAADGRKKAAKRELIDTGTDKRFVRRGAAGKFKESDDVGKSLSADRRKKARTKVKSGQGDK